MRKKKSHTVLPCHSPSGKNSMSRRRSTANPIDSRKLVAGPAKDTSMVSFTMFRKFRGLMGTGLAQPKTKGPVRLVSTKTNKPMGSM